jgi:hypothetical protein
MESAIRARFGCRALFASAVLKSRIPTVLIDEIELNLPLVRANISQNL